MFTSEEDADRLTKEIHDLSDEVLSEISEVIIGLRGRKQKDPRVLVLGSVIGIAEAAKRFLDAAPTPELRAAAEEAFMLFSDIGNTENKKTN